MLNPCKKVVALFIALQLSLLPILSSGQTAPSPPKSADLVNWMSGTVLCIQLRGTNTDNSAIRIPPQGSGFLVSRRGYVLTNSHVVRPQTIKDSPYPLFKTDSIKATFQSSCDFTTGDANYTLEIVAYDDHIDLALLKIKQDGASSSRDLWRYIPLGDSDRLRTQEKLLVVGYPGGNNLSDEGTVKSLDAKNGRIQFKSAISPGYSGGPVLDERGYVVGVVWGGELDNQTANYFIPINFANSLLHITGSPR